MKRTSGRGGTPTNEYRIYELDAESHIVRSAYFTAVSDQEAVDWARQLDQGTDRELWHGHRKVRVIKACEP